MLPSSISPAVPTTLLTWTHTRVDPELFWFHQLENILSFFTSEVEFPFLKYLFDNLTHCQCDRFCALAVFTWNKLRLVQLYISNFDFDFFLPWNIFYKLTLGTLSVWQTPSLRSRSLISQEKTLGHSAFVLQKVIFHFASKLFTAQHLLFFLPPCILRSFWPQLAWKSSVLSHRSHGAWCCRSRSTCNKQLQCRKAMEASGGHIGTRQILPCVKKKISSELGIKSISFNLKWESNRNWV